jgi:protein TonB
VGGNVQQARLVRQAKPVYPPLARQAGISGHVLLNIIVNNDGTIQKLMIASGHPRRLESSRFAVHVANGDAEATVRFSIHIDSAP